MKVLKKGGMVVVLVVIASAFAAGSASADVVYTYTGNDYTTVMGHQGRFGSGPPGYTTSDFLSISLTLTAPLAGNLNLASVLPDVVTYSYSDGFYSYNYFTFLGVPPSSHAASVEFSTDASGNITNWAVLLTAYSTITGASVQTYNTPTKIFDVGYIGDFYICPGCSGSNTDSPGTWSFVPAPTIGAGMPGLVAACAGLLFWWRIRRPWRSSRA